MTTTSSTHTPDTRGVHGRTAAARWRAVQGFSLLELLVVVAIVGTLLAMAIGITPSVVRAMKGDSIAQQLNGVLREAREQAIARRRNIVVTADDDTIVTEQVNVAVPDDGDARTELQRVRLEGGLEFLRFDGQPDTPDAFGGDAAVVFSGPRPHSFTTEGTFVDANGDPSNGTLFIGQPNQPTTAAAITIFGPTAAMHTWRWDGREWVQ